MYRRNANSENPIKMASSKSNTTNNRPSSGKFTKPPLTASDLGPKRSALSTVTNTTTPSISGLSETNKSRPLKKKNPKEPVDFSTEIVAGEKIKTSKSLRKQDTSQSQDATQKIFPAVQQTHQHLKQQIQTTARQKQTAVWIDKNENPTTFDDSKPFASQKPLTNNVLASITQQPGSQTRHLKRKIYSIQSDDTEPEDINEEFNGKKASSTVNSKFNKTSNGESFQAFIDDSDTLSSKGSESASSQSSQNIQPRKSTTTHNFSQKNKKLKQHRQTLDPSMMAVMTLAKTKNWPFDEVTAERKIFSNVTAEAMEGVETTEVDKKIHHPLRRKWRSKSEVKYVGGGFRVPTAIELDINKENFNFGQVRNISLTEGANVNNAEVDDLEHLSSETEIVLSPRHQRRKREDTVDYDATIELTQHLISDVPDEELQAAQDQITSKNNGIDIMRHTGPEYSYQVTISSNSRTNPHALFPVWDDEALGKMRSVSKTFENMPGIFDEEDEDTFDISMVTEYSNDIFIYMRKLEFKYRPDPDYMDRQVEIDWKKRGILIDWLVRVHAHCNLLPETLFLTVNYIDRFLSLKAVEQSKFQLVGIAALFIAAKYEEITCPSVQELAYIVEHEYSVNDILRAERYMIDMLQFNMGWPGPMSFLRRSSKADDYDSDSRTLAKYFLELTIMDQRFVASQPSWLAAAAHCLARIVLNRGEWSDVHVYFGSYTKRQLQPAIDLMIDACKQPLTHHRSIYEKYTEERFKWASLHVAEWIYNNYNVDTRRH